MLGALKGIPEKVRIRLFNFIVESYEFLKPLTKESDELVLDERDDDCRSLSAISHPSKYQIG